MSSSIAAPALVVHNNELYISWTGTDDAQRLNIMRSNDGRDFAHKAILQDTSIAAPTLMSVSGALQIGWAGRDNNHRINIKVLDLE